MELQNLKTHSLQELIRQQIKRYIVDSNLKGGDALPTEKVLAGKLGISRTVIRESLKGLQAVGLIEAVHGKGYFIKDFNLEALLDNLPYILEMHLNDFRDILQIRIVLESHYLTTLIDAYTREDVDQLNRILAELAEGSEANADARQISDIHSRFHCQLYRRSGNRLLMNLIKAFATIQKNLTNLKRYHKSETASFIAHHRGIIEAIEKRDAGLARERLISHFGEALEWVNANSRNGVSTV